MEHLNRYDGIDPRVLKHIRATARRLARQHAVPGMDAQDLEQDLVLDLWCRMEAFDPARASFRTFAHRVIAHRVATLTSPTARRAAERATVPLDMPAAPGSDVTIADLLPAEPDDAAPGDSHALRLDVARFIASLTPALRRCCDILLSENVAAAAEAAGLHRSSVYENAKRLKRQAIAAGLGAYFVAPRHFANRAGT